jgi:Holliday junction resolvase-like predicted endonuclease
VDYEKRSELSAMARQYLRLRRASVPAIRADVVSVYTDVEPPEIALFKDAFGLG